MEGGFDYKSWMEIITFAITVGGLVFTLYLWLLDKIGEDESKFVENKKDYLQELRTSHNTVKGSADPDTMLKTIEGANQILEVIMSYRFWTRSKKQEEYAKINAFYQDNKYLISTMRRVVESKENAAAEKSLIDIPGLDSLEIDDIRSDYCRGLLYTIDFLENGN